MTLPLRHVLVATLALGAAIARGADGNSQQTEPSIAPAVSLPDVNGRIATLGSYSNRPVLLVFYRGFW